MPEAVKTISLFHSTGGAYNVSAIFCSKMKKFLGRGTAPSHYPLPVMREKPSPHTSPVVAFGDSILVPLVLNRRFPLSTTSQNRHWYHRVHRGGPQWAPNIFPSWCLRQFRVYNRLIVQSKYEIKHLNPKKLQESVL